MDLELSEEQKAIAENARSFFSKEYTLSSIKTILEDPLGYSPGLWEKMSQLGWMGLIFPEKYGGLGGSFLDLVVLLEEMGRACIPGPFFSSIVLGGSTIFEAGSESQKAALLPKIVTGDFKTTLALLEVSAVYDARGISFKASRSGNGYALNGTKLFVPDAHVCDYIILVCRTEDNAKKEEGVSLFLVESNTPGVKCTPLTTIASDRQSEVVCNDVKVPSENVLGKLNEGWVCIEKVLQKAAIAKCAEMVGGAQRVLELTVEYTKQRKQFEQLIGSFQAIQHHCSNMAVDVDTSRLLTYEAAWMIDNNVPCAKYVSMAKSWVSEAFKRIMFTGHQIQGGISLTEEHEMPLHYKRAKSAELAYGDADFHREKIAHEIGLI